MDDIKQWMGRSIYIPEEKKTVSERNLSRCHTPYSNICYIYRPSEVPDKEMFIISHLRPSKRMIDQ